MPEVEGIGRLGYAVRHAGGMHAGATPPTPYPTSTVRPSGRALSEDETATLNSLEQLDEYPLYTMRYQGDYPQPTFSAIDLSWNETGDPAIQDACQASWGCALFAALGDASKRLYGRNFDWRFSPAVLLFTDPPDGYASVSMVDIDYLGFEGDRSKDLITCL